jgi:hypothetical protein
MLAFVLLLLHLSQLGGIHTHSECVAGLMAKMAMLWLIS